MDEYTVVDTAVLADIATRAAARIKLFEGTLNSLETDMSVLADTWDSVAAEKYRLHFNARMHAVKELFEQYKHYPGRLQQIVGEYDHADVVATNIATSIEVPQWAEV